MQDRNANGSFKTFNELLQLALDNKRFHESLETIETLIAKTQKRVTAAAVTKRTREENAESNAPTPKQPVGQQGGSIRGLIVGS